MKKLILRVLESKLGEAAFTALFALGIILAFLAAIVAFLAISGFVLTHTGLIGGTLYVLFLVFCIMTYMAYHD